MRSVFVFLAFVASSYGFVPSHPGRSYFKLKSTVEKVDYDAPFEKLMESGHIETRGHIMVKNPVVDEECEVDNTRRECIDYDAPMGKADPPKVDYDAPVDRLKAAGHIVASGEGQVLKKNPEGTAGPVDYDPVTA